LRTFSFKKIKLSSIVQKGFNFINVSASLRIIWSMAYIFNNTPIKPSAERDINKGWLLNLPKSGCLYLNIKYKGINIATRFLANDFSKTGRSPDNLKKTDIKLKPTAEIRIAIIPFIFGFTYIASILKF